MRFTVIIPGDDLDEAGLQGEDLYPAEVPQQVTGEDPVLAVRDFGSVVREEPTRCG